MVVIYLFSATELHQLLKFPVLVSHYSEHKNEDPSMSIWAFLEMHYAHGIVMDEDYEKDMKLPFKTSDSASHINIQVNAVTTGITIIRFLSVCKYSEKQDIKYTHPFIDNSVLSAIWQPPKSVV